MTKGGIIMADEILEEGFIDEPDQMGELSEDDKEE